MLAAESKAPPAPWERGEVTRAEMAVERGVSGRHLRRQLARERAEAAAYEAQRSRDDLDPLDFPLMAITTEPDREPGHWVHIHSGRCSAECGVFHVGGEIRNVLGGPRVDEKKPERSKHKFRPKAPKKCPA